MMIDFNDDRPIFIQIAEGIEDAILSGAFPEESQIPSITEFSVNYRINPATALKGITMLVDSGIVYKKRGLGMFVSKGAVEKLKNSRKEQFYDHYIKNMLEEAKRLQLTREDIILMIERGFIK
ncbi:GntR family transcriptional regulator [Mobilitalea sibirica]|uniref:GntR family transcriptional regulator n=1 Tax=Mobilitalea sibirica TaxID=1462919 RepID=A0A8J7HB51_9FIRM|nr:GntR family transcriptional regulator [Mobilitalea sibirica]MBH1940691.1 GntR family transcriptional regulator [Mobilitalea sibirica]